MNLQYFRKAILVLFAVSFTFTSCKKDNKDTAPSSVGEMKEAVHKEPLKESTTDSETLTDAEQMESIEKAKKQIEKVTASEPLKTTGNHVFGSVAVPEIMVKGSVSKMLTGDFTKTGSLSALKGKEHIYAVGEVANLKGNVQVIDGKSYVSTKIDAEMMIEESFNAETALLVYAKVERWKKISIPKQVQSKGQFRLFITQQAREMGIDMKQPFPFMIEGNMRKLNFTVMNWNDANPKDDSTRFFGSGYQAVMYNQEMKVIGFYSEPEKGSYIMKNLPFHAHFVTNNKEFGGHVDDMFLGQGMSLKLPLK